MIQERLQVALRDTGFERRYRALDHRERLLLHVASAMVLVAVLYVAVFAPAYDFHHAALDRYAEQQYRLDWMRSHEREARLRADDETLPGAHGRSLLTLVDATAREANVRLTRYRPENDGSVNVVIQEQRFDDILRWTKLLVAENLRISQVAIDGAAEEGVVNAGVSIR